MRKKKAIEQAYAQAQADQEHIVMLLEDEASFHRQPTAAWSWSPAGRHQPRMALSYRANTVVRAAIGFDPVRGGLVHRLRSRFSAREMGRLYQFFAQSYGWASRIFLVMDNWPVHGHPTAWRQLQAERRFEVLWLPTYAPWLNPAEKIWKWVRQKFTHMHPLAEDWPAFRLQLDQLLASAAQNPQELLRYTGTGNDKLYSS